MTPASVVGIATFFLFVIPGICYELLRRQALLPVEESAFVQISRILLSGALLTASTFTVLVVLSTVSPSAILDLERFVQRGDRYLAENLWLVSKTLVLHVLVAALLAAIVADLRLASKQVKIHRGTGLFAVTEFDIPPGHVAWLAVHLKNGNEICGYYYGATTDLEPDKRELILQAPLRVGDPTADKVPPFMAGHWKRMVIFVREIEYVTAAYVDSHVVPPEPLRAKVLAWISANALRMPVCLPALGVVLLVFAWPWP